MITPKEAGKHLREYLETVSDEQFREDMRKYNPHIFDEAPEQAAPPDIEPSPIQLTAYLASALTQLTLEERAFIERMSAIVVSACEQVNIRVYEPKESPTTPGPSSHLSDKDVFKTNRWKIIGQSDLLILLGDYPSFGAGQELDFAYNALIPILIISHAEVSLSRMVTGMPSMKVHVQYHDRDLGDLENRLREGLGEVLPVIEKRKQIFARPGTNGKADTIGSNIKRIRKERGLTRKAWEELVSKSGVMELEALLELENQDDYTSNPSLIQLSYLASMLNTTVEELLQVDPLSR